MYLFSYLFIHLGLKDAKYFLFQRYPVEVLHVHKCAQSALQKCLAWEGWVRRAVLPHPPSFVFIDC